MANGNQSKRKKFNLLSKKRFAYVVFLSYVCRNFVAQSWGVGLIWGLENPKQEGSIPSPTTNLNTI